MTLWFRDIASLQNLLLDISTEELQKAVTLLEKAEVIYLLGQLRASLVAKLLRYILTMLGSAARFSIPVAASMARRL